MKFSLPTARGQGHNWLTPESDPSHIPVAESEKPSNFADFGLLAYRRELWTIGFQWSILGG